MAWIKISLSISNPSNLVTTQSSFSSMLLTILFKNKFILLFLSSSWTNVATSKSKLAKTWFLPSIKFTLIPSLIRFSLISNPINPPPITVAVRILLLITYSLILKESSTVFNSKIFDEFGVNLIASAPKANINLS